MKHLALIAVILLWYAAHIVAEDTTPAPPITIKRIIQHQEGKPARAIDIPEEESNAVPGSTAITFTEGLDLTGSWTIAEDSKGGRVSIKDRQLRIKSGGDGALIAEFVKGADCPTGSGQRTHYIKGNLSGSSLSGTIHVCPSAAFITKCGDDSVYTTKFQAEVRDANTIAGRYTATGYSVKASGCIKDSYYDSKKTFLLKRRETGTRSAARGKKPAGGKGLPGGECPIAYGTPETVWEDGKCYVTLPCGMPLTDRKPCKYIWRECRRVLVPDSDCGKGGKDKFLDDDWSDQHGIE